MRGVASEPASEETDATCRDIHAVKKFFQAYKHITKYPDPKAGATSRLLLINPTLKNHNVGIEINGRLVGGRL